tara:strand:- start:9 stop:287 length:279 start_codon:yes stop_codon:yes gene_type:complete
MKDRIRRRFHGLEKEFDKWWGHVIELSFNQIDEGDNIIINVASDYKKLYSTIYNITDGGCFIYIHNQSDVDIPHFDGGATTEQIKLTITIIN